MQPAETGRMAMHVEYRAHAVLQLAVFGIGIV